MGTALLERIRSSLLEKRARELATLTGYRRRAMWYAGYGESVPTAHEATSQQM